jgi:hypothetical protein
VPGAVRRLVPPPQPNRVASPWDDGPSVALPADRAEGERSATERDAGAWELSRDEGEAQAPSGGDGLRAPRPERGGDELSVWMRGASELVALNDFSGALDLAAKILSRDPSHAGAQQVQATCEENLIQMYESRLGSMERRPRVAIKPDEVIWLNLDPRAGFVLAQIDGEVSFEDLYAICGLSRLDTARILSQLLEEGVIAAEPPKVAARARP